MRLFLILTLVTSALAVAVAVALQGGSVSVGSKAPDFALKTPSGETIRLSDRIKAGAVLLAFWSEDAQNVDSYLETLEKFHREFRPQGLTVLGVNQGSSAESAARYLRQRQISFPTVLNERGSTNDAVRAFGVRGFPTSHLISKEEGVVRFLQIGFQPREGEEALRKALAEEGFGGP